MGAIHGRCRLLYFVKSKIALNARICCFIVFYVNTFIFVFPEMAGRGGLQPP